ncbi:DoxX family protein [Flavobacterium sp.]|uniref:DoxX family protein n=1 Tax=Flavobacterium sp. TaxID=239 RepID=UPI002B4ACC25|nr:DoxX family protein [Flavobacterium sp.]HLF52629.1 DoxX family protein [Flavobacterium sp.]
METIDTILQTEADYVFTIIRVVAGIIIFPYGMQKLLGWFDDFGGGVGINASLNSFKEKRIPLFLAWMVIIGQSIGSVMLIIGFMGRFAAICNFIIFTGALFNHLPDGWTVNWSGKKRGEGIEYFILLLTLLLIIAIKGSGAYSIDYWLALQGQ